MTEKIFIFFSKEDISNIIKLNENLWYADAVKG